uniref:CD79a molecule, immunoglobulin-associated alpha n=1 Tax=Cyprinodon variegatus TaxID=28743 RepID=A0A3Q2E748_CYPVA
MNHISCQNRWLRCLDAMFLFIFFLFFLFSALISISVKLEADKPSEIAKEFETAKLKCCYQSESKDVFWVKSDASSQNARVPLNERVFQNNTESEGIQCSRLTLKRARMTDTGFYQCSLYEGKVMTHGTYLRISSEYGTGWVRVHITINLSESTKNKILTVEGVLLLLCVIIPSASLLLQSQSLHRLEMKKMKQEEENIYQGLNLDDCCTTYDQIERSQSQGQYQDVCNAMEEKEEIVLEKP